MSPVADGRADHFAQFVSVVVLFDHTSQRPAEVLLDLHGHMAEVCPDHELVVVLNGTPTVDVVPLVALVSQLTGLRLLRLDGTSTTDAALVAGAEAAIGEYVVTLVGGQEGGEVLRRALGLAAEGHDVVQGRSEVALPGTLSRRTARRAFWWWSRHALGVSVAPRATYLTCLSRARVDELLRMTDRPRNVRAMVRQLTGSPVELDYLPLAADGGSSVTARDVSRGLQVSAVTSARPLGASGTLAVLSAVCCLVLAVIPTGAPTLPWSRLQAFEVTASLTVLLVAVTLRLHIAHVGRLVRQAREEPGYRLVEEVESLDQMTEPARRNTVDERRAT